MAPETIPPKEVAALSGLFREMPKIGSVFRKVGFSVATRFSSSTDCGPRLFPVCPPACCVRSVGFKAALAGELPNCTPGLRLSMGKGDIGIGFRAMAGLIGALAGGFSIFLSCAVMLI
jgi:hypothetical protein